MPKAELARKVTLPLLTFYGLGTILGAGIYVLIGEVTLRAGTLAPLAFGLSAVIASITAYSFARLSSMFPRSAGEAAYTLEAFHSKKLSAIVGISVVLIGTVSAATMIRGFTGYLISIASLPEIGVVIGAIVFITMLSIWGIKQSVLIAAIITLIEIGGLIFVMVVAFEPEQLASFSFNYPESKLGSIPIVFFAAFISFYAYIGFEDIVNIAEETIDPSRVLPLAILFSVIISTLLYIMLSIVCTVFVPANIFEQSEAPFAAIVEFHGFNPVIMVAISVVAIINGALVQQIKAARVLYGMASQKLFFSIFGSINPKTQTPVIATLFIGGLMLTLSLLLDLITLAVITSAITLVIFMVVQASLLKVSLNKKSMLSLDILIPVAGIVLNTTLLYFGIFKS
jgi:amino acid transporter